MNFNSRTAAALMSALALAREFEGPAAALRAAGIDLEEADNLDGFAAELGELLSGETTDESLREALALGFLAGHVAHRPGTRTPHDATSFVMDHDLLVQGADGESILRLPWFDEGLFVGRQLPDITEMPAPIRKQCVDTYTAALAGERGEFEFTSYGHAYAVDAIPVRGAGGTEAVLAVATPTRSFAAAVTAYERTAERLDRSAAAADDRAALHRVAGRLDDEAGARDAAEKARIAAERARSNAERLHARGSPSAASEPPSLTSRETEVLLLASHGLTLAEIAEQLTISAGTVRTHFENIYPKLGVSDKAAAVAAGLRHGLID